MNSAEFRSWIDASRNHPGLRPGLAALLVAGYALSALLLPPESLLYLTVFLIPFMGWAIVVLLGEVYSWAEPAGLALPATMLAMLTTFTLLLWLLTTTLLAANPV